MFWLMRLFPVIGFTGEGKGGKGGEGKGKYHICQGSGKGKGKASLPTIWQRWQRSMFTGAGRRGAANCHVGIPPAFIIATFIGPRWKAIQNLSQIDEPSKDEVKFKVLELAKLDKAVPRVVAQLLLSFATFATFTFTTFR